LRLDLEWRSRLTTDLLGEKSQILLDPLQEGAQVSFIAHIRRVARRERRTVISETENPITSAQQRPGETTLR